MGANAEEVAEAWLDQQAGQAPVLTSSEPQDASKYVVPVVAVYFPGTWRRRHRFHSGGLPEDPEGINILYMGVWCHR